MDMQGYLGARPWLRRRFDHTVLILSLSACIGACSGSASGPGATDGGRDSGKGGDTATGGAGTGGARPGSGGTSGSGGKTSTGGSTGAGGTTGAGGAVGTGGAVASGGAVGTGGSVVSGGTSGSGGKSGLGGAVATGGSGVAGGALATGGGPASGGATGTGGKTVTGGTSGTGGHTGVDGGGGAGDEYGFTYRPVQSDQLDWLCTLQTVGPSTYVYVRLDQTGSKSVGIATVPVYTARLAQISVNGTVIDLAGAQYDYGGGHHNDSLQIDYQGKTYEYYHSSFGFGWRQCQPFDCVNCSSGRTFPEICVPIKADGTHAPLVDTFKKCAGDTGG